MTGPLRAARSTVPRDLRAASPHSCRSTPAIRRRNRMRRFASAGEWYPAGMTAARGDGRRDDRPILLFFSNRRSGPARRMASLVAWFGVTEKKRLRVVQVDTDANEALAQALEVSTVPTLVLLKGRTVLDRLDGRATGKQISRMISPHVAAR